MIHWARSSSPAPWCSVYSGYFGFAALFVFGSDGGSVDILLASLQGFFSNPQITALVFILLIGTAAFVFALGAFAFVLAVSDPLRRRLGELAGAKSSASTGAS